MREKNRKKNFSYKFISLKIDLKFTDVFVNEKLYGI